MRNALSKGELIKFRPKTRAIVLRVGDKYFGELEGKFIKGNTAKLIKNVAIELTKSKNQNSFCSPPTCSVNCNVLVMVSI